MGEPEPSQDLVGSSPLLLTPEEAATVLRIGRQQVDGVAVQIVHLLSLGDVLLLDEDGAAQRVAGGQVGRLDDGHAKNLSRIR